MNDITFQYPWAVLLLFFIPALFYARKKRGKQILFSSVGLIGKELCPSWFKRRLPDMLAAVFMAACILGLANLQYGTYWETSELESRWIMLVQDLSGSMNRIAAGEADTTLGDITLDGAEAFIDMRHKEDLIGIVAFSNHARLVCPPTFDKEILHQKSDLLRRESDSMVFRQLTAGGATNASHAVWVALNTLFMLLPEQGRLSFEELAAFRHSLLGKTQKEIRVPEKLRKVRFGHGMAIVLFTDGRIEANKSAEDIQKGLPNFINVANLLRALGVKLYPIVVGESVNPEVQAAIESRDDNEPTGKIFYMPRQFDRKKIMAVYEKINEMEKNRLLVKIYEKRRETRGGFTVFALIALMAHGVVSFLPGFRTV